jgi:hypothetical protein
MLFIPTAPAGSSRREWPKYVRSKSVGPTLSPLALLRKVFYESTPALNVGDTIRKVQ